MRWVAAREQSIAAGAVQGRPAWTYAPTTAQMSRNQRERRNLRNLEWFFEGERGSPRVAENTPKDRESDMSAVREESGFVRRLFIVMPVM